MVCYKRNQNLVYYWISILKENYNLIPPSLTQYFLMSPTYLSHATLVITPTCFNIRRIFYFRKY